jgi:2-amino-4-hydroxy-6-hydroxymethyldihydropteridine diphosphokinase
MADVYVAAGSNVEPIRYLSRALDALDAAFGPLTVSPAYRNPAVGFEGPDFVNLVVGFTTDEAPSQVRAQLQQVEAQCDRPGDAPKWAPRTMDLDILLYGSLVSSEPGLVLPRPDLVRRAYMLKPMADIAPQLLHPTLQKTMRELWDAFDGRSHVLEVVTIPRCDHRRPPESAP